MANTRKSKQRRSEGRLDTVADLTADPKNARRHGERNISTLVSALREVGAARSIVIDEVGRVLAGNATVEAAGAVGIKKLRVVDADGDTIVAVRRSGLTEKEKARLALFDNRTAELAEGWNLDVLRELQGEGVGLDGLWTGEELAAMLDGGAQEQPTDGLTDPDEIPEPRQTKIKRGDVYQLGEHRIICGDAQSPQDVARLLGGQKIDFVVSSPPYNVDIKYRSHKDRAEREAYLNFIRTVVSVFVPHMPRGRFVAWNIGVSPKTFPAHQVVTLEECGLTFYRQVVWQKSGVAYPIFPTTIRTKRVRHYKPNYTHELVQVFETPEESKVREVACTLCDGRGRMAILELPSAEAHETVQLMVVDAEELGGQVEPNRRYANDVWPISQSQATVGLRTLGTKSTTLHKDGKASHMLKEHPAPFPVELPRAFLGYLSGRDEIVYDPFGGSGSTLIACEQMHRRARLAEIDPVYCQVAIDRWTSFTGGKPVKVR